MLTSDSLFLLAAAKFHLQERGQNQPIESLKKRVLKVSKLRDTKILEISAALAEPKLAQSFVQYLAERTVALSQDQNSAADRDLMEGAQRQLQEAQTRLDRARKGWNESGVAGEALAALQTENDANADLLGKLQLNLAESRTDLAGYEERQRLSSSPANSSANKDPASSRRVRPGSTHGTGTHRRSQTANSRSAKSGSEIHREPVLARGAPAMN